MAQKYRLIPHMLKGATITSVNVDEDGFPYMLLKCIGGRECTVWFSRDEEQNGPGTAIVTYDAEEWGEKE